MSKQTGVISGSMVGEMKLPFYPAPTIIGMPKPELGQIINPCSVCNGSGRTQLSQCVKCNGSGVSKNGKLFITVG